jgi:hypothetical protein
LPQVGQKRDLNLEPSATDDMSVKMAELGRNKYERPFLAASANETRSASAYVRKVKLLPRIYHARGTGTLHNTGMISKPAIVLVLALAATGSAATAGPAHAVAAETSCGGVVMGHVMESTFDKDIRKAFPNNFAIDGALFENGKNLCKPVTIQCYKNANNCEVMIVNFWFGGPRPEFLFVNIYEPMQITQWTESGINASGQIGLCMWGQLSVNYDTQKVRFVTTAGSGPGCKGGPVIDVLDVQSDPLAVPGAPDVVNDVMKQEKK